jgi:hypothetical protein
MNILSSTRYIVLTGCRTHRFRSSLVYMWEELLFDAMSHPPIRPRSWVALAWNGKVQDVLVPLFPLSQMHNLQIALKSFLHLAVSVSGNLLLCSAMSATSCQGSIWRLDP